MPIVLVSLQMVRGNRMLSTWDVTSGSCLESEGGLGPVFASCIKQTYARNPRVIVIAFCRKHCHISVTEGEAPDLEHCLTGTKEPLCHLDLIVPYQLLGHLDCMHCTIIRQATWSNSW